MGIYFLVPVYNESENVVDLSKCLLSALMGYDKFYVFVDDCSKDGTINIINEQFSGYNYHIIAKDKNLGPGDSFNRGFEWILNHSKDINDIIVTLEGDNTSDIQLLPQMVSISTLGFDIVLASVYAQGGGFEKTNIVRKLISFFANMIFRSLFNIKILTLSSFYRVYKIKIIDDIRNRYGTIISEKGFISMLEILIKAINLKSSIIEIPMILKSSKRKGKSKIKIFKTGLGYIRFLINFKIN
jgi:dolichol-phosphate mannosyltransferase